MAASRKAAKRCSASREYLGRLATWVLLLQLRYIYCPHILLSYIVYNIFLVLVHASVTVTKYNYLLGFLAINRIIS